MTVVRSILSVNKIRWIYMLKFRRIVFQTRDSRLETEVEKLGKLIPGHALPVNIM